MDQGKNIIENFLREGSKYTDQSIPYLIHDHIEYLREDIKLELDIMREHFDIYFHKCVGKILFVFFTKLG